LKKNRQEKTAHLCKKGVKEEATPGECKLMCNDTFPNRKLVLATKMRKHFPAPILELAT
jgi:hypothetical protein